MSADVCTELSPLQQLQAEGLVLELDFNKIVARGTVTELQRATIRAHRPEILRELRFERRRERVLAMLQANPVIERAWFTELTSDFVILAGAIRGVGTFEISIAADRYDHAGVAAIVAPVGERT